MLRISSKVSGVAIKPANLGLSHVFGTGGNVSSVEGVHDSMPLAETSGLKGFFAKVRALDRALQEDHGWFNGFFVKWHAARRAFVLLKQGDIEGGLREVTSINMVLPCRWLLACGTYCAKQFFNAWESGRSFQPSESDAVWLRKAVMAYMAAGDAEALAALSQALIEVGLESTAMIIIGIASGGAGVDMSKTLLF